MNKQRLIIEQLDKKLSKFENLSSIDIPSVGWIKAIRTALRMSLRQLGDKINITAQSVKEIEEREKNGTVSIKILRQVGEALDMKFVYGFIPKNETLNKMIEKKAKILAEQIVKRTSVSMKLEDQENQPERIKKAIEDKTKAIIEELPKQLWN